MSSLQTKHAREVLEKCYRLFPKQVKRMNGYQQVNFKATLQEKEFSGNLTTRNYIMKFTDTSHFSFCGNVELQHKMLQHLRVHGIQTSFPVATVKGGTIAEYLHGDKIYCVQMLSFIEGVSINEADFSEGDVQRISQDIGRLLGTIHQSLSILDYNVEAASDITSPYHIQNALVFRDKVDYVQDKNTRQLIEKCFHSYATTFLSQLKELRKGFIHGDFSDSNIIVSRGDEDVWNVSGVIDFEECCYGYVIGDVGILVAYVMLKAAASGADPLEASRLSIRAYETQVSLTTLEKRILFDAVSSRMAVSFVSASYEAHFNPENREFVFSQAKSVPTVMKLMEQHGRKRIEKFWFEEG